MSASELEIKTVLKTFISKFETLSVDEKELITENITAKFFKKGSVLLKEGDISNQCYFVLKGCLRYYIVVEGIEKTTQFYTEEQAAVFFTSYINKLNSDGNLVCLEDSIVIVGEMNDEIEMYNKFPKLKEITSKMMMQDFGKTQEMLSHFISSSPEERYLHLLKNKSDLLQRVPQHQLASYIGVTPESLSRIRKRIQNNK